MGINCEYLVSTCGVFKILTILFGGVSIGLGSYSHFESFYIWKVKEEALIGATAACVSISIFYLLAHLSSEKFSLSKANRAIDIIYHILSSAILIIIGAIVIDSTVDIDRKVCRHFPLWPYTVPCQLYEEKLTASVITVLNGVLYGISAFLIMITK